MSEQTQYLVALHDKESLETSTMCLNILSTLLVASGAILTLAIQQGIAESNTSSSWLVRLSIFQYLIEILAALIALGILLARRIRRIDTIRSKLNDEREQEEVGILVPHSKPEFYALCACVACAFVLFASATVTLGLCAFWRS